MSAEPAEKRSWTPDEYLAWERLQPTKHEFFDGEIFAMAGATLEHNLLVANVVGELRDALRKQPCNVCPSDMRVNVPATGLFTYPDAVVFCGKAELKDEAHDTLLNPTVLVEVLSESSEAYDRGKKFEQYRSIPSFTDYLLVAQDHVLIEHFSRQADSSWVLREARAGGRIDLASIGVVLQVDEIYLKVFSAAGGQVS
jgi:Uma2 family endonuclease